MSRRLQLAALTAFMWSSVFLLSVNKDFLFPMTLDEMNHDSKSHDDSLNATTQEMSFPSVTSTNESCAPSCINCSSLKFYQAPRKLLKGMFEINRINETDKAICVWNGEEINKHLPHWLEIVYRCWSWWMIHNDTHHAVIEIPAESEPFWKTALTSPLGGGLWKEMKRALSIEIAVIPKNTNTTMQGLRATPILKRTPWFANAETAHALRAHVVTSAFPGRSLDGCSRNNANAVRIGILDRLETRHLLNHNDILTALQTLTTTRIIYKTFEGASYQDQIDFYSSVDILVTPHGAQLSAVPFMPSCGCVLELLPKHYHFEEFFGSLTSSANLTSSFLYLSDGNATQESILSPRNYTLRKAARAVNLCPPITSIVTSVQTLMERWKSCCSQQ
jgi:hypothetical protein